MEEMNYDQKKSGREMQNKAIVESLYKALIEGEIELVTKIVASDLEWWFHGPQQCNHMMRILTGQSTHREGFKFEPRSIEVVGDCVIAEGWEGAYVYWVHVWTIDYENGLITQFREYFNTWLTVRSVTSHGCSTSEIEPETHSHNHTLWQSHPRDLFTRSLPGVILGM